MLNSITQFEKIYCLEVPNGLRVRIDYKNSQKKLSIHSDKFGGGLKVLFCEEELYQKLASFGLEEVKIHGVFAGPNLSYYVFDVKLNDIWIDTEYAKVVAKFLRFDFVKDTIVSPKEAEFQTGVILKPIHECIDENGKRVVEEIK